jgi:hypothetical protein
MQQQYASPQAQLASAQQAVMQQAQVRAQLAAAKREASRQRRFAAAAAVRETSAKVRNDKSKQSRTISSLTSK